MYEQITHIRQAAENALAQTSDLASLEALRIQYAGKKGEITALLKSLGQLAPEERRSVGQAVNELRDWFTQSLDEAKNALSGSALTETLAKESIDITLPGKRRALGHLHPITTVYNRIESLFISLGFTIAEGPHVETVYHNFDALNTPHNHSSRDEQDTFYFGDGGFLLRPHTSPVQVRTMQSQPPPIRIIAPGKTFRRDEIDATHTPAFHQMEGLVVDKGITMGDLIGIMDIFARHIFGADAKIRLRPSFFPFTEPSAEVDVSCYACTGKNIDGCRVCKDTGWLELLGCGMVHPKVLQMSGIDPAVYSGYAFGFGVDRITSTLYGITDPRLYFENDVQFLSQF